MVDIKGLKGPSGEFGASGVVEVRSSSAADVWAFVADVEQQPQWYRGVKQSKVVGTEGNCKKVHQVLSWNFLALRGDMHFQLVQEEDPKALTIETKLDSGTFMKAFRSRVGVRHKAPGVCELEMEMFMLPSIYVPFGIRHVVGGQVRRQLRGVLSALQERFEERAQQQEAAAAAAAAARSSRQPAFLSLLQQQRGLEGLGLRLPFLGQWQMALFCGQWHKAPLLGQWQTAQRDGPAAAAPLAALAGLAVDWGRLPLMGFLGSQQQALQRHMAQQPPQQQQQQQHWPVVVMPLAALATLSNNWGQLHMPRLLNSKQQQQQQEEGAQQPQQRQQQEQQLHKKQQRKQRSGKQLHKQPQEQQQQQFLQSTALQAAASRPPLQQLLSLPFFTLGLEVGS